MQIIVSSDAATELDDPDNCRAFSIAVPEGAELAELVQRSGVGELDPDGEHVHVDVDVVRQLAVGRVAAGWDDDFAAMIAYARTKGWVNDAGSRIRAHLETI